MSSDRNEERALAFNTLQTRLIAALPAAMPIGTALAGAGIYYFSYVSRETFLGRFGLNAQFLGSGAPELAGAILPAIILGTPFVASAYLGSRRGRSAPPKWMNRWFSRLLSNDPQKDALRAWRIVALLFCCSAFYITHVTAVLHGHLRSQAAAYMVANHRCISDCFLYKTSSPPKEKGSSPFIVGVPLESGPDRIAILSFNGVNILKNEDITSTSRSGIQNVKPKNTSLFRNFLYHWCFYRQSIL